MRIFAKNISAIPVILTIGLANLLEGQAATTHLGCLSG